MKIAKKIMLVALAVIALTLVMSISIFAEDATGTVYEVATQGELDTAFGKLVDGDTIKLTADIDVGNTQYTFSKAVTFDLNGQKLTTTYGWTNILLKNAGCVITSSKVDENGDIVRGTIFHKGGTAIIKVWHADKIENVDLISSRDDKSKNSGGIAIQNDGTAYVGSIKNVSVSGDTLTYGIETQAREGNVIGTLENVTLTANTNGIELKGASVGSATNCTISGKLSGIAITKDEVSISLVGCEVSGGTQAVNISATDVSITANNTTDFESESGTIFNAGTSSVTYDVIGYTQNEDGTLTACAHENVVAGSCTVKTVCSDCTKVLDYVHSFVELNRVDSTCTEKGYVTYACSLCGTEEVEALKLGDHTYNGVVTAPGCETEGYTTYTCTVCGDSYEDDKVAATGHSYNGVVTDPTCDAAGFTTYTCSCGDTYTEEGAAALGHKYVETSRVEATEEENGYIEYTCSVCQGTMREELLYCAHDFVVIEEVKVSCLNDGYAKYECSLCGETKEETIKKEAHTYDWNIVGCPKCGTLAELDVVDGKTTNVSSNLGYTIYFATTLNDLSNTNYDVIRLKNNISLPSGGKITNENAIIDLGGNVLYRDGGYLGLRVVAAKGFVNGYVYKTNGGSQIMAVTSLGFMEDVTLAANSTKTNNATGLLMNTDGAYLGSMKNVTICAGVLSDLNSNNFDFVNVGTNGIYNHGIEATKGTIGSMENVKISTYGQAITSAAKIGTMTNCVFSADGMALNITKLHSEMVFVNCEIHSKNIAIYIANADDSTADAPVSFVLGNTKIITDGAVYALTDHIKDKTIFEGLTSAVALVNGQLYTSLEDAVNALKASTEEVTTFALIGDLAVDSTIVIDKKVNFSFGGASYDVPVYGTNQVVKQTAPGYTVTSSVDVVFSVVKGGYLTVSGDGKLIGGEHAIVADGGEVIITAGTYVGYNPRSFVATSSCVVNNDGTYTIAAEHDYDDEVGADKTNYQVDGVCNNCGFVRGNFAVDNVYYATIEEALAAALVNGKQIVLAADIVLDGDVVWDLTGATFNFNALTVTGNLSIIGGNFTTDVTAYLANGYCSKYVNNVGYVVSVHEYVAGAPAADGAVTYTCAGCDDSYVINNAAINGEYYLGTDLVVFNNGVLSAMGREFSYTYNVTSGMIDTNADIFFQVIDGTIYLRGAEPLHQHTGEGYIAEEQADGSINYICPFCGNVMYVINNAAINGEYYLGTDLVVFNNGVLTAMGGEFNYTYNVTSGMIDTTDAGIFFQVIDGTIYFRSVQPLHQHNENTLFTEVTEPTCSTEGYTTYICQYCGPLYDADRVPATGEHNYVEVDRTETEVNYVCTECGDSYSEDIITHTHTEVEIPAILPLPSNNHTGMTAGVQCSECGEILVPRQAITANPYGKNDGAFKFTGATLTLAENISVNYKATMPTNYTNVYVVFDFINSEFIVNDYTLSSGKYSFNLSETRPHLMNENIIAYLYAIDENGDYVYYEHSTGYSIVTYCFNTMKKLDLSVQEDKDEYTMFSDILVLGAETQKYVDASTLDSELVTNIVEAKLTEYFKQETKLTPSTFPDSLSGDLNKQKVLGEKPTSGPDWSGVSLLLGSTTEISFKFMATSLEGVTAKVTFDGEEYYYTAEDFVADETVANKYSLNFSKINSLQYGEVALAEFFVNGESFGRTVEYSIYTYIQKNYTKINHQTDLIKALYNYSESVIKIYG